MPYNFITNIESCYIDIPHILYYSHIPTAVVALFLGVFVFANNKKFISAKLLLLISILFSLWSISDIIIWVNPNSSIVMFLWSVINLLEIAATIATFNFAYVFFNKEKEPPFWSKLLFSGILVSFAIFIPTQINLQSFDIVNCEAVQGPLVNYFYAIEIFNFLCLFIYSITRIFKTNLAERKQAIYFSIGVILFSASFSVTNLIGSIGALINPNNPNNWEILQYGLFGMPVFMVFLTYMIVKFKTFNIKLFTAQVLVWGLIFMIGAQFFFIKVPINFLLTGVTFISVLFFGHFLVNGVRKEIEQKESLQILNLELQDLIKQRESLVYLITHKIKGSFTRSKYIFAEMMEGSFGVLSPELKNIAKKGLDSDNAGITTVDLILNAYNLQKGTVKYDMQSVDFKAIVLESATDKKGPIEDKKLVLETEIKDDKYIVLGDSFWLKEIVNNLLQNSILYTKEGKIIVGLSKNNNKVLFFVKDTGIGITDEDKENLFTEGGRGKNSIKTNVDSTGYGLFSTKLIVDAHKGRIWAESEGGGKGSTFFVEFDAIT